MDTRDLCLGALCLGDASGYDIKKLFELAFSHFQAAGYGSIYPALTRLTNDGLITGQLDQQEGRPERRVFSITAAGRKAFRDRLTDTDPQERLRSDFLLLMFFAHELSAERLESVLDQYDERLTGLITFLESLLVEQELTAGMRFSIEISIAQAEARLAYLRDNRHRLGKAVAAEKETT